MSPAVAARPRASLLLMTSIALMLTFGTVSVRADAGWLETGDAQLRLDLQLLNDAEIIRYPSGQWPIPRAGIEYALANAKDHYAINNAVAGALARVRARLAPAKQARFAATLSGGQAGRLRDFDSVAREDGEIGARMDYETDRFAVTLSATGVSDPADGQSLRLDGSQATGLLGNWLVSANVLDRWWGPGHESSLILSNNARPMPTVMVERAEARPFESAWLNWLGPWRFSIGLSQMEDDREDIDSPKFLAWRVVVMPFRKMELGISRTAQFCGDQLVCNLDTLIDLLIGNDNVGIDTSEENEPGNQMAGFDLRWTSPLGNGPYALYAQYIGEDESSYLPVKYLGQLGLEVWRPTARGDMLQMFAEYANTACSGLSSRGPYYNCAYNQARFGIEGYRYRGRSIGHTVDNDAESYTLGGTYSGIDGTIVTVTARASRLNHDGFDPRNTVSPGPADYAAFEVGWRGKLLGQSVAAELGVEAFEPEGGERDVEPYGFLRWSYEFAP